jgi:TorA maturation chaperone TorD
VSEGTVADGETLSEEDLWRAALYALIGRLFFDGPDVVLLAHLSSGISEVGGDDDAPLPRAWRQLAQASSTADVAALQHEHAMLFIGVGKTPVTPYTSAYAEGVSPERHLLLLRQQLAHWGLGRDATNSTPEDHLAGVCDTMRHLIERGDAIDVQKEFFNKFICLQSISLCRKLLDAAPSSFYVNVARFTQAFIDVEREGFDMIASSA